MQALDSAYEWGINKQNQGNLSGAQILGLGSLAPQSGFGLLGPRPPAAALNPYGTLPTPTFAPGAAGSDFNFEQPALETVARDIATTGKASPLAFEEGVANVGNPANTGANAGNKPYFDPNYPYESMLALKNWLAPQVAAGVAPAENARGLNYSGVGAYGKANAENYLSGLTPAGETPGQALGNDFDFLYGPNITNSLIKGTPSRHGDVIGSLPASLKDATPFGDGGTNAQAALVANPSYLPSHPATSPYTGTITDFGGGSPGGGYRVGPSGPPQTYTQPAAPAVAGGPQFGLYDLATNNQYAGPGYWYNPNSPPDAADMPWLKNATPYSAPVPTGA